MATEKKYESNVKFSRAVGKMAGYKYIKWHTSMGEGEVCSQDDFDKGKVIIMQGNKRITKI